MSGDAPRSMRSFRLAGEGPLFWGVAFAASTLCGGLEFAYRYLDDLTRGHTGTFAMRLLEELTGAYAGLVVLVAVVWLWRTMPVCRRDLGRTLAVYAGAFVAVTVTLTSLRWATRSAIAPLVGLGPYDYGRFPTRFFMEAQNDLIWFVVTLGALALVEAERTRRTRERREAELRRHLVEAQLRNLRLQLQPHFLFNALNTISQAMYHDPAAADEMLGHLAELLRQSLRTTQRQEVPLGDELATLDRYVAIMRARFGDDVAFVVSAPEATLRARVPSLLLQPLVENAVRHGSAARVGRGRIDVRARRDGDRLVLEVENDGGAGGPDDGEPASDGGSGVGLAGTAERLALLYGTGQTLATGLGERGGFLVSIRIPFHADPAPPARRDLPELSVPSHARAPR